MGNNFQLDYLEAISTVLGCFLYKLAIKRIIKSIYRKECESNEFKRNYEYKNMLNLFSETDFNKSFREKNLGDKMFSIENCKMLFETMNNIENSNKSIRENAVKKEFLNSIFNLMRNTPLIKLNYLSEITGNNVYAKCEHLLPFTSKDRMIKNIFYNAIKENKIKFDSVIYEGSSGSTCYSVAMIANLLGLKCKLVIPDDLSQEKLGLLKTTNAELVVTKQCPFSNFKDNYVRLAKKLSLEDPKGFFIDQFENENNWKIHYYETGPEIINDCISNKINIDLFVSGAGTGGTITGISKYFKRYNNKIKVVLSDVTGSGLYSYVKNKVIFTQEETEANRKKYRYYTSIEGIGVNFLTNNFKNAEIDDAVKIEDSEAIEIAKQVYLKDGVYVGGSTAVNFSAIVKYSKYLPKGSNILTVIYDSGLKYTNKLYV